MTLAPPPPVSTGRAPRRRWLLILGIFLSITVAIPASLFFALGVVMNVKGWKAYGHPNGTMRPMLLRDDVLFVETDAYRHGDHPDYGDVVVAAVPLKFFSGPNVKGDVWLAWRVIGRPGDRVEMRRGVVAVNGRDLPQEWLGWSSVSLPSGKLGRWRERAPNGRSYEILLSASVEPRDLDGGPWLVPPGHYFVAGDDREDSVDSRYWAGRHGWYLPARAIVGRAGFVYWSGPNRLDRIGTAIK